MLRILLVITGGIGAYASLAWAIIFFKIIQGGQVILIEPVEWIIRTEFYLALCFVVVSLLAMIIGIRKGNPPREAGSE